MNYQTPRHVRAAVAACGVLSLALAAMGPAFASGRPAVMPNEMVLTEAQQEKALMGMSAGERARREAQWSDPSVLPVSYARAYFVLEPDGKGGYAPVEVGGPDTDDAPNFHVPTLATAATTGTGGRYDLYISIAVVRMTCSGCYQWGIDNWADWKGGTGMDWANGAEDMIGTSWGGNLWLNSDSYAGEYNSYGTTPKKLDIYRSDVTAGEGVGWSFHEWTDFSQCCTKSMNWGDGTAYIRESSWKYTTDNAVHKYFHTKGSNSYSLTFYNAGITISPNDSNQWSAAAFASFSH